MRLMWLIAYLSMCGYDYTIVACNTFTGEVFRIAPLKYFGILGTALFVKSFELIDNNIMVVYLE